MAEDRVIRTESADGNTHTTIVTDGAPRRSGGGTVAIVIALLLLAGVGLWAFSTMGGAEVAKDNAIADAANSVGNAAGEVGDAAKEAAEGLN